MRIRCDAGVYSEPFRMTVLPANNGIAIALNARILYSHYQLLDGGRGGGRTWVRSRERFLRLLRRLDVVRETDSLVSYSPYTSLL